MIAADKLIQFLASIDDNIDNSAIQPIMPAGVSACSTEGQKIKAEHALGPAHVISKHRQMLSHGMDPCING